MPLIQLQYPCKETVEMKDGFQTIPDDQSYGGNDAH